MKNFLCRIFGIKVIPHELIKEPVIGECWYLKPTDGDPFPRVATPAVHILDIKQGWVRYSLIGSTSLFNDNRLEMEMFLRCYQFEVPKS